MPAPSRSAGPSNGASGADGTIVFYRTDDSRSTNTPFSIDPDGSHESQLTLDLPSGIWSPDGSRLLVSQPVPDRSPKRGAETAWVRPALVNPDGSGLRLLDAYPARKMQLFPLAWATDGSRIFVQSGDEDVDPADMGLYTVRSSDGADLSRIRVPPPPFGYGQGFQVSPDGARLLEATVLPRASEPDLTTLFVANADGTQRHQVSPRDPNTTVIQLEFWGGISEAWSPDGSQIAFCAFADPDFHTALYLVNPDGSGLHEVVPTTTGAISVQWSPDGKLFAFTSESGGDDQIAVIHPDGTGLKKLTDDSDGSVSVAPVWSPDGTKLLFQRKRAGQVTLWTMNADGSGQTQLTATPVAAAWVGGYAWDPTR